MASSQHIVVTLHCPQGFRTSLFLDEARKLSVETLSAGFSQLILVFAPSAVLAATDFALRADGMRMTDPAYQHLQVGVAIGGLREPLKRPMPDDDPLVIESFKIGLSRSKFLQELEKIEQPER